MEVPKRYDKRDRREICAMVRFFVESGRLGEDLQDICDYMNLWGLYHPELGTPWTELSMGTLVDADYEVADPAPAPRQSRRRKTAKQSPHVQSHFTSEAKSHHRKPNPVRIIVPDDLPSIPNLCTPAQISAHAKSEFYDMMKALFQEGLSMDLIAQTLNENGLAPEGFHWTRSSVKRELTRDPEILKEFLQRSSRAVESFSEECRAFLVECLKASMSVRKTASALNQRGFKTPQGRPWKSGSLFLHIDRDPDLKMLLATKAHRHYEDDPRLKSRVLDLLNSKHTMPQVAAILSREGFVSVTTGTANWSRDMVRNLIKRIRHAHQRSAIINKGA